MRVLAAIIVPLLALCTRAYAGYTHYFTWHQAPEEAALKQCVAEMNRLIEYRKSMMVSPDEPGSIPGSLKLDSSRVDFNGIGEEAHEPFVFPGRTGFNSCKTAYKPYDEVVTACLLVARDHFFPSVLSSSSDGSWNDWTQGVKLYSSVFRRVPRNPFSGPPAVAHSTIVSAILFAGFLTAVLILVWFANTKRHWLARL